MNNRINANMAKDFLKLQKDLPKILKAYNVSMRFVALGVSIPVSTFSRKVHTCDFTAEEMIKVCNFINK